MGRPERPLDPELGPLQRFASDLRQLRQDAGSPSYRELARKTQYSTSVLSRAASGRELPSLAVTLAYASACGGDAKDWQARWETLARQSRLPLAPPGATADPGPPPRSASPRSRGMVVTAGVLTAVAALAVGWLIARVPARNPSPAARATLARLHDGADPADAGCVPGAVIIAVSQIRAAVQVTAAGRLFARGAVLGTLELRYSARCRAEWAKVIPAPAFDYPVSGKEVVGVFRPADGTKTSYQPGYVEEAYSDMLFTSGGCVSAYAVFMIADGYQASARTQCRQGP